MVAKQLQATGTVSNDYFGIPYNTLCFHPLPRLILHVIVFKCFWENGVLVP